MAERQRQVLDAAFDLACSQGFAAVSMEAIAARLGVSRPVVYAAFANAVAVVEQLVDREAGQARERVVQWLPPRDLLVSNPEREIPTVLRALAHDVAAQPAGWSLLVEPAGWTLAARRRVEAWEERLEAHVVDLLADLLGADGGGVDAPLVALTVVAGLKAVVLRVVSDPENHSADRFAAFGGACVRAIRAGSAAGVHQDLRV